ncbi:MAG: CvpA family protein [Bacteroides sp.]|nr:CvpA family protein [Bacteroides sp.]MCM1379288.1 CvpA family protein [Bacteroides sp.]MCM1445054.1 CvpA family protein [Prevotella sp.]
MATPEIVNLTLICGTVAFAAYGAWKGFIPQLGSVAAFLLGFLGSKLIAPSIASQLEIPVMLCYIVMFAIIFILTIMLCKVLHLTVKMLLLGPVDRLLGAIIGAAKWLLLTSLLINLFLLCAPSTSAFSASFAQWVTKFAMRLFGLAQELCVGH